MTHLHDPVLRLFRWPAIALACAGALGLGGCGGGADEGPAGVAKIAFNLARKPQIRERVLGMRGVFRRHADHIGAIGLILRKK